MFSDKHLVMTDYCLWQFVEVKNLKVGDDIIDIYGNPTKILRIITKPKSIIEIQTDRKEKLKNIYENNKI